jgi:hypothetical protein
MGKLLEVILIIGIKKNMADCLEKMWESRRLTKLRASTPCYRISFKFLFYPFYTSRVYNFIVTCLVVDRSARFNR